MNTYVGFRYVPLFCGVWDNSKGYEALSVVTHNNGGYTSNKPVPAGIEPGTDNGEYWAYTYRAGGEASAIDWDNVQNKPSTYPTTWGEVTGKPENYPTNWASISDKPTTFPPSTHSHSISNINGLSTELEELTNDISGLTKTLQTVNNSIESINTNITSITNSLNDKMNSPINSGSNTSYFLRWSSNNRGAWATLPTASASRAGTMSSAHYTQVQNTKRYVSNEGKNGIFNFRYWSDGFVELWAKVEVSNLSVSTTLGNMYRSGGPYTQTTYKYPYTFTSRPFIFATFFSTNSASALVWLNPVLSYAKTYLPQLYLVRPTKGTCTGDLYFYVCGNT